MVDIFDLYAKITLDSKGYTTGIDNASAKFNSFKSGLGSALADIAKLTAAAVTAGAAAVGKIVKDAVANYGEYEQLVGGIETLFKGSAGTVQENAEKAFATAQISANQYMDLVTSFSASLIQSTGKDYQKSANLADKAVIDMADNANKMGTNMQSIQNAYQGFAKQNYTMLDNLKLGYGGTKTEMERLVKDAEKLNSKFKATKDKNGELTLSFGDIVEAIHIVQQDMGITGTSAEEAGTTIQGSMASVKAAWQDVLTAMGSGKDISTKLDNLTKTVSRWAQNMKPIIKQAVTGAVQVVKELAPEIAAALPELVAEVAPDLLEAGAGIVTNLASGIYNQLANSNFDQYAKTLTEKVNSTINAIDADGAGQKFSDIINKFINTGYNIASTFDFKDAAKKLTDFANSTITNINWGELGATMGDLWKGVWDFIGTALENIDWENIGEKISEFINGINWWGILDSMFKAIGEIIKGAPEFLLGVIRKLDFDQAAGLVAVLFAPKAAKSAADKLFSVFKSDNDVRGTLKSSGGEIGGQMQTGLDGTASGTASGFVSKLSSGLKTAGVLAEAAAAGYAIGTVIRKAIEDTAWFKAAESGVEWYLDNTLWGDLLRGSDDEVQAHAKSEEAKRKAQTAKNLKDAGAWWLSGNSNDSQESLDKARKVLQEYNQYKDKGVAVNDVLYNTSTYQKAKSGPAWTVDLAGSTTNKQTGSSGFDVSQYMPKTTNIYLDTGALVGGTSTAKAQQTNYTSRGYAQ